MRFHWANLFLLRLAEVVNDSDDGDGGGDDDGIGNDDDGDGDD